jgi:hypothetical protein
MNIPGGRLNKIIQNCLIRRTYDKRRCGAVMTFIWGIRKTNFGNDGIRFRVVQELTQLIKDDTIDIEERETFTEEMIQKVRDAVPPGVKLVLGEISEK